MSELVGQDTVAVRQFGQQLKHQAQILEHIAQAITALVGHAHDIWAGPDASAFLGWWDQQHRPALLHARDAIDGLGQSAMNNADDQDRASGNGIPVQHGGPGVAAGVAATAGAGAAAAAATAAAPQQRAPGALPGSNRTWQQVQQDYEAKSRGYGLGGYAAGGEYAYQCTAWANYRWRELGYTGPLITGNGGEMAAHAGGSTSVVPTAGAMASYGTGFGHVMIVEETSPDASHIRVSEMNTGDDGSSAYVANADEYRSDSWWTKQSDGTWLRDGARTPQHIVFASLPR